MAADEGGCVQMRAMFCNLCKPIPVFCGRSPTTARLTGDSRVQSINTESNRPVSAIGAMVLPLSRLLRVLLQLFPADKFAGLLDFLLELVKVKLHAVYVSAPSRARFGEVHRILDLRVRGAI